MEQNEKTRKLLTENQKAYPLSQPQDVLKFIYQSSFGCEHMVSSVASATEFIRKEYAGNSCKEYKNLAEPLDGDYSRVYLSYLNLGLSAGTLARLFVASARNEADGRILSENKINVARKLAAENAFSFSTAEFEKAVAAWKADGCPAIHHSDVYKKNYKPSYRVIANRYVKFLPVFARIDKLLEKGTAVIAVEGGSASGKTTLAALLHEIYGCTVFHMDDFFLRPVQRTAERYKEPGGNVDRERFLSEVLVPLSLSQPVQYRRFDCSAMKLADAVEVVPEKLTVIEGAYSMHPELAGYYDLSVFMDISAEIQKSRINVRNTPDIAVRFFDEWIPLENKYFSAMNVKERCDITVSNTE